MTTDAPTQAQLASQMSNLMARWRGYTDQLQAWLGGTVTGGPNADGMYPLTDHRGITFMVPSPALEAARVDGLVNSASSFSEAAQASADAAVTHLTNAGLARDAADEFANAAKAARDLAKIYADEAGSNASNALAYSQQAAQSVIDANTTLTQLNSDAAEALTTMRDEIQVALDSMSSTNGVAEGFASAAQVSASAAAGSAQASAGSAQDSKGFANASANSATQAATFNPALYATLASSPTFTGDLTARTITATNGALFNGDVRTVRSIMSGEPAGGASATGAAIGVYDRSIANSYTQWYSEGKNFFCWNNQTGNTVKINPVGELQVIGSSARIVATTADPAAMGYVAMQAGSAAQAGYIEFRKKGGTRSGYIGWGTSGTNGVDMWSENGHRYVFNERPVRGGSYILDTEFFSTHLPISNVTGNGNYNSLTRNGVYRIQDGSTEVNYPPAVSYGQMLVMNNGTDTTAQLAIGYNTGNNTGPQAYYRGSSGWGGSWGLWRALWDDNTLVVSSADPGAVGGRIWIQI